MASNAELWQSVKEALEGVKVHVQAAIRANTELAEAEEVLRSANEELIMAASVTSDAEYDALTNIKALMVAYGAATADAPPTPPVAEPVSVQQATTAPEPVEPIPPVPPAPVPPGA